MPRIQAVATAVPPHRVEQSTARREMTRLCEDQPHLARLLPVFDRSGVESRHLLHPPAWYSSERTFDERNREYAVRGLELAEEAVLACLARAGVAPDEIDHLYFVTTTGLATPSLDALLVDRLHMRTDIRRSPLFGLGCAGGAGALVRAFDVLSSAPSQRALVVSVELCSLIFSTQAKTPTDLVGAALFGDGAAATLVGGDDVAETGIAIDAVASQLFPDARHLMGWDFTSDGMRLVLSRDIPTYVGERVAPAVAAFTATRGKTATEITHHVLHPGGPKVMTTYRSAFALPESALRLPRACMREYGNLSSAAVLFMLSDLVSSGRPARGDTGLLLALGPGFAAEMLMLSW
jgi:alkylresorcinol/alkylpyrone synthase